MRYKEYKKVDLPWIEEIPSHWEVNNFKKFVDMYTGNSIPDNEKNNYIYTENSRPYISTKDISKDNNYVNYNNGMCIKIDNLKFKVAKKDSTLVCIEGGSGGEKVAYVIKDVSFVNKLCCIKSSCEIINDKFIYYFVKSNLFKYQYYLNVTGDRNGVSLQKIRYFQILIPPKEEQEQIARFLDWKINEIDRIINLKTKELDNLEKLIESKIEEALLLNNKAQENINYEDALKDIPTIRIKNIFTLRNERNLLSEDEIELLSLYTKLGVLKNKDIEYKSGNKNTTVLNYKIVKENDIVVNIMLCWMGAIGISKYDGVISPAYDVYIPDLKLVNPLYYHYFFRSNLFKNELYKNGKGIVLMKWRVYSDKFMNIRVPLFTLKQQDLILKQIENIKEKFKKNSQNLRLQIKNLKQLKQSLISDVVTGKIDVRNITIPDYDKADDIEDNTVLEENFEEEV